MLVTVVPMSHLCLNGLVFLKLRLRLELQFKDYLMSSVKWKKGDLSRYSTVIL